MIYLPAYRFLRQDQRSLLSETAHRPEREIFLDCLAALHDLALHAGGTGGRPAFTFSEVEAIFRRASHWNSPPVDGLRQNLEINWKTVAELPASEPHADEFADDVIRQYRILSAAEPAATATSRFSF